MKEFEGELFLRGMTIDQFFEILAIKVVEVMEEKKQKNKLDDLPQMVSRKETANLFRYKDVNSLNKYHGKDLTVKRKGRSIFYPKTEVVILYQKTFQSNF